MPLDRHIHLPIGTREEIEAQGMDPAFVACCAPPTKDGSVKGCAWWEKCQFHRKALGGFKGEGPKNVGFYMRTANSDGAQQREGVAPCFRFVATLQPRMLNGLDRKNRGQDHEVIQVIAQEGEKIVVREWKTVAPDGGNKSKDYRMKSSIVEMTVPKFPRPGENPGVTYDNQLDQRAADRERRASDLEDMLADQMAGAAPRHRPEDDVVPDLTELGEPLETADATPTVPLAQPVKKKGRG
ncbi:MAG: hypothetical protein ACT4PE_05525 [Candidatus Eiseniibacteriota bacterium]